MDGFTGDIATGHEGDAAPTAKRTRTRDSLFLAARLRLEGQSETRDVRIRNLSAGGMMAELGRDAPTGTVVELEMRGLGTVHGRVAWSAEGRIGIALDTPIDPQRARKPVGRGSRTPFYAKASGI